MSTPGPNDGTVLIVDDDPHNLGILSTYLEKAGLTLLVARNGAKCLDSARLGQPDVILLDIMMPGMDGYETCRRLKDRPETRNIPVLFLSALSETENVVEGFKAGGVDYIKKPFQEEEVLARVQAHATIRRQERGLVAANEALEAEVTERKRVETELTESREWYHGLCEAVTDALYVHEILPEQLPGRFVMVNDVACRMLGYSRQELLSMSHLDIDAAEADTDLDYVFRELARGRGVTFEHLHRAKDGRRIPVEIHAQTFRLGEQSFFISLARDISDRKRAEAERLWMERRVQTVQRLESLGIMAGGIAHDFNNILMVVQGNIELAKDDLLPQAFGHKALEEAEKAANRATGLVRQMLAYSGKGHFVVGPADMKPLIESFAELLRSAIPPKVTLQYELQAGLPPVTCDETQIQQTLINLVVNAAESYDPEIGGPVTVSATVRTCDEACLAATLSDAFLGYDPPFTPGRYVAISVADGGCGMDEETRKHIFEPFYSTKFQGRGLGLAAVLGIVRGHKGYIEVDSVPGRGTAFTILLPAVAEESDRSDGQPMSASETGRGEGRILVVDDEAPARSLTRRMLERLGYTVICAADGVEAMDLFARAEAGIDAVLIDLSMPGMSGVEVLRAMRLADPSVPAILTSGYAVDELQSRYGNEGFGFLQKPFQKADLGRVLAEVM